MATDGHGNLVFLQKLRRHTRLIKVGTGHDQGVHLVLEADQMSAPAFGAQGRILVLTRSGTTGVEGDASRNIGEGKGDSACSERAPLRSGQESETYNCLGYLRHWEARLFAACTGGIGGSRKKAFLGHRASSCLTSFADHSIFADACLTRYAL